MVRDRPAREVGREKGKGALAERLVLLGVVVVLLERAVVVPEPVAVVICGTEWGSRLERR